VILALERVRWSLKHDLLVPALVVMGLWVTGAISTPDQAVEAARHAPCFTSSPEMASADGWHAQLAGARWVVHKQIYRIPFLRLKLEGTGSAVFDAETGRITDCSVGVND
jgi:hypothetical protein